MGFPPGVTTVPRTSKADAAIERENRSIGMKTLLFMPKF